MAREMTHGREWVRDMEQEAAFQRMADRAWEKHLAEQARIEKVSKESRGYCHNLAQFTAWTNCKTLAAALGIRYQTAWYHLQRAIEVGDMEFKKQAHPSRRGAPAILYRWKRA